MNTRLVVRCCWVTLAMLVSSLFTDSRSAAAEPPNILFILCDDMGYGDVGVLFQNSRAAGLPRYATPQLDRLAGEGLQMRRHYCPAPVCAPSRASLLLGVHQGHANVRNNQFDKALEDNYTVASVLKRAGYATAAIGKWGLEGKGDNPAAWPAYPTKRGFDYFFGYVRHKDGHEHYPREGLYDGAKEVWENGTEVSGGLAKCYTADLWTARAKQWILEHQRTNSHQPFFLYLAYDTPHAALEFPTEPYPAGGGLKGGLQWLGQPGHMINTASGQIDSWCHPDYRQATYRTETNPAVPWPEVYRRYATSMRRLDDAVGDLKQSLQDLHLDDNTLVVFTSDNGPSIESYLPKRPIEADFFDSYGPHDGIKRDCWEGGMRMPTFARWPGHIPAGGISYAPSAQWDWMATFCNLAGLPAPARSDGVSLLPTLTGHGSQRPSTLYGEYFHEGSTPDYADFMPNHRGRKRQQMQWIQLGAFKGVRYNLKSQADDFEIYNVVADPKEGTNLAGLPDFAALQQEMKERVLQARRPDAQAPRPYDDELVPVTRHLGALTNGVLRYAVFEGEWPWVPQFDTLTAAKRGHTDALKPSLLGSGKSYGVEFDGYLQMPRAGDYTFYLRSDSGAELRVHEATVIDDDFHHSGAEVSASIRLQAGVHALRLSYRHAGGAPLLALDCSGPQLTRGPLPKAFLLAPRDLGVEQLEGAVTLPKAAKRN